MRELVWSNTFRRALRRTLKRQPQALADIQAALRLLQENLFGVNTLSWGGLRIQRPKGSTFRSPPEESS